jgi:metal-responsive CopG/Arc/MetJ family transcriptional regulator
MEVKIMPTEKPRYTITLDEEMLKKIDDFRFENRFANRTQATLELIRIGMEQLEKQKAEAKRAQKNKPSAEAKPDK